MVVATKQSSSETVKKMITTKPNVSTMEWAMLRTWSVGIRDDKTNSASVRDDAKALISIIDTSHWMSSRHPALARKLWESARQLADKILGK